MNKLLSSVDNRKILNKSSSQKLKYINLKKDDLKTHQEFDSLFNPQPKKIYYESTENKLEFNVMPNLPVEEKLFIKMYRLWDDCIEAVFDREYHSTMQKSPNHLIFLTALVHVQKMLYVYMCNYFDDEYNPYQQERLKIWPTDLEIKLPKLIIKRKNISHRLIVSDLQKIKSNTYAGFFKSYIENIVTIDGKGVVILI